MSPGGGLITFKCRLNKNVYISEVKKGNVRG